MDKGISEPKCKAILLCDKTIIEAATGKISLIGTFTHFALKEIPGRTRTVEAFCQFTDAEGRYDLVVEIHNLQNGTVIARATGPAIEIPNRLMRANVIIPIPSLSVGNSGAYDFVIFANGSEIDRQQFSVNVIPGRQDDDDQDLKEPDIT